ncbi:hypothetical protein DL96DRAFT_1609265 [Flagelloscypha sp. PMI_526]|nr:hypothetical protein DL96DRAFT_1609265 [Flagelloscypha sp. PMI_526]
MALPPPHRILEKFFTPFTINIEAHNDGHQQPEWLPSSPKDIGFSRDRRRLGSGSLSNTSKEDTFDLKAVSKSTETVVYTVVLETLLWLEDCARTATARSAMWQHEILLDIQNRSDEYRTKLDSITSEGAEQVKNLNHRAFNAARTLLSLDEVPLPSLPDDLIHCIFLWVACQGVVEAKGLSFISQVVRDWVDPCIFKYLARKTGFEFASSPRMRRAKAKYFVGCTLSENSTFDLMRVFHELPQFRSISCLDTMAASISTTRLLSFQRLHIDDWNTNNTPLSHSLFSNVTHLSLNSKTLAVRDFDEWDLAPLNRFVVLRYFIFHTHFLPDRGFCPNDIHAALWNDFMLQKLFPCIPSSVDLWLWVVPDIAIDQTLRNYQVLFDGRSDRRFLLAFEKGDGVQAHATSESAGAGHYAFVYPALNRRISAGLDWLEVLWEEAWEFLKSREAVIMDSEV